MRLTVIVYDALLLFGVIMVGYGILFTIFLLLPAGFDTSLVGRILKVLYLIIASYSFYAWFWTHGGQTLGMKVWNIYLIDNSGKFINWQKAALRYLASVFSWSAVAALLYTLQVERWYLAIGLGFTWMLINKNHNTWHDSLTGTRLVRKPKQKPKSA